MKALFIGGTGTISSAITRLVTQTPGWELYLINTKVKRAVPGFVATTRFDQGARMTVEHILAHPELQAADPEFDAWCDRLIDTLENAKKKLIEN